MQQGCEQERPVVPQKYLIEKPHLVEVFHASASFAKIVAYLQACAEAVEGMTCSDWLQQKERHGEMPSTITFFTDAFFPHLLAIVADVPLEDMKQQRFGNKAFRVFHSRLEGDIVGLMRQLVATLPGGGVSGAGSSGEGGRESLALELAEYMRDAFGNSVRIDYGTGHELHFFIAMIICMEECGDDSAPLRSDTPVIVSHSVRRPPPSPAERGERLQLLRRAMVFEVFTSYLTFMRLLQRHYKLEPAGSHGVWGLDDFHHLPFVFGASQLINKEVPAAVAATADAPENGGNAAACGAGHGLILPKHVCEEKLVRKHAPDYLYFAQVLWVLENKVGPFFEHSSMLYNISGVESWQKTYTGMVKMYAAEVLLKFNVVQHLLFGQHLPWEGEH
uniref:Serine/threonine-protein phosphatase 2A activator n=1 Tax=Trypanosoma congolense (strain IL3000) TaxID=1068625 RepID=G0URC9_TRYCI|nr:putative phosphotyrosyl phosphate activator protein [Trypanosoma congolense IL3000]